MNRRKGAVHRVTVEIAGGKHVLRSDRAPDYTRAVASHVDGVIRALESGRSLEPYRTAILAALSITDELFHTREELRALRAEISLRSAAVEAVLDRAQLSEEAVLPASPSSGPDLWDAASDRADASM